jgi:hypothetical protein
MLYGYKPKTRPDPWTRTPAAIAAKARDTAAVKARKAARRQLKPRRSVRRVSRAKAALDREDRALLAVWWQDPKNQVCAVPGCGMPADARHHVLGRTRKLQNDTRWWVGVCRVHHDKVKADPAWAKGLALFRGTAREMPLLGGAGEWMCGKYLGRPAEKACNEPLTC